MRYSLSIPYHILPMLVAALALVCSTFNTLAQDEPRVQQQDGIDYVSGGIGDTSQAAMKAMAGDFNLHVTSAVEEGNYLADIQTQIMDPQGNTVLDVVSNGPLLYANLPPGDYTVLVSGFGQSYQESVQIGEGGPAAVVFHWNTPGADDALDAQSPDAEGAMKN